MLEIPYLCYAAASAEDGTTTVLAAGVRAGPKNFAEIAAQVEQQHEPPNFENECQTVKNVRDVRRP